MASLAQGLIAATTGAACIFTGTVAVAAPADTASAATSFMRSPCSTDPILEMHNVSCTYEEGASPVISDVNLSLAEGEMLLVIGRTGAGKTTPLNAITGAFPHATGGLLRGQVSIVGRDTATHPPRMLSDVVGVVGQDPAASFVTDSVTDELTYGMEQLGIPVPVMRKRVEEKLDLLGIADLRDVPLAQLSGGQQQRVALGAVLTTRPALIVLDEPTSALDPNGTDDVLATVQGLAHDLAMTVVLAEHRIERVLGYVDRIAVVHGGEVHVADPATAMLQSPVAPPIIELGRLAGWKPLPLSIRDARRKSPELRKQLYNLPEKEKR